MCIIYIDFERRYSKEKDGEIQSTKADGGWMQGPAGAGQAEQSSGVQEDQRDIHHTPMSSYCFLLIATQISPVHRISSVELFTGD